MIKRKLLRCSFCRKNDTEVLKLVAGPRVLICDACVAVASRLGSDSHDEGQTTEAKLSAFRRLLARARQVWGPGNAQRVRVIGVSD